MTGLNDYADRFINKTDDETTAMFEQGLLILEAIADGHKPADVKREFGIRSGKGKTTMANRELVARVFGDEYAHDMDWSLHLLCCKLGGVKISQPETYAKAHEFLQTAITGYPDPETGIMRPYSTATLKEKFPSKPKAGQRETVYRGSALYKGYTVEAFSTHLTVSILDGVNPILEELEWGTEVTVTITRSQPQPAAAPAESESAA